MNTVDIFKGRGRKFYTRQLTHEELVKIARLNIEGWPRVVISFFLHNDNTETPAGELHHLSLQAGYPHAYLGNWSDHFNQPLRIRVLPYRLAWATRDKLTEHTLVRLYEIAP
jgi:hypothetical protein